MTSLITDLEVRPIKSNKNSKLRAYVCIEIAGKLRIRNLRIIKGQRNLFVAMPQMKKQVRNGLVI